MRRGKHQTTEWDNRLMNTLNKHNVEEALVIEINHMAASRIPREYIIQHVGTHFPEKSLSDWNDIVIAAVGSQGKHHTTSLRFKKANKEARMRIQDKYILQKNTHDYRKKRQQERVRHSL